MKKDFIVRLPLFKFFFFFDERGTGTFNIPVEAVKCNTSNTTVLSLIIALSRTQLISYDWLNISSQKILILYFFVICGGSNGYSSSFWTWNTNQIRLWQRFCVLKDLDLTALNPELISSHFNPISE
jgi:hypothetical protein